MKTCTYADILTQEKKNLITINEQLELLGVYGLEVLQASFV